MRRKSPPRRALRKRITDRVITALFVAVIGVMRPLPYRLRVPVFGWITTTLVAPLAGWRRRIGANLAHAWPELPEAEVARLMRLVPDRIGRSVIEFFSPADLIASLKGLELEGPGVAALEAGLAERQPLILASGHIGNYTVFRALIAQRYGQLGALYRPMSNASFDRRYVAALDQSATPLFARNRRGLSDMVTFLRAGNPVAILHDQFIEDGAAIEFFGQKAATALSAADLARRYGAPLIPFYAIRQPDGRSFRLIVEAPIPPGDPAAMMQALTASLEVQVRAHPEQWIWTHRRWGPLPKA
ncbi:lauroyl acyltransferase [Pseudooceanicola sp.]|uniref:lysophospholipid acyltransferase family protein n=1 Tax=Pseudooceanicola sp. TaxID=1914328 RepID=UPI00263182EE|nr:lauroyl acyltransferase [Pseudooceanicola sp.]MDF1854862.1 lauroyl acyltransferase [Pseudooceanicola sp.]